MINRILLVLSSPVRYKPAARWTINIATHLNAQLFVLYFLPGVRREPTAGRDRKNSSEEERAWQVLYEIEDQAFSQNVRISLLLETGELLTSLNQLCESYGIDLVVVNAESIQSPEQLLRHSPRPVVFFKTDKEE